MIKTFSLVTAFLLSLLISGSVEMRVSKSITIDSLGACQGIFWQGKRIFLYGDREVGILKEFKLKNDSMIPVSKERRFTLGGKNVINHPTGIAHNNFSPTFIGNSIRQNPEGTKWKAMIYCINWGRFLKTGNLDGNLLKVIEDDACIQGTRPAYVNYHNKWYVATADYGNNKNEVRLYDPEKLATASKTSDPGVLFKKFNCAPWVQNLNWIPEKGILVLIQNQIEGRKWRFTYVDLEKSIDSGEAVVINTVNIPDKQDELEGFAIGSGLRKGIAVTSSKKNNVNMLELNW